jgi:hypothetical protein
MPMGTQSPSALRYHSDRIWKHLYWARTQGLGRLVEEDGLDPVNRIGTAMRKRMWRRVHGVPPGTAVPVYVVGVQRSGTNMLLRGLEAAPEVEVHNENDRRVFNRFILRSDDVVAAVIRQSRHRYVLFKPLCDSHRVDQLLALPGVPASRAVWIYRDADDRARSAVTKFGDANLRALSSIARGDGAALWQAQRLSPDSLDLLRSFNYATMTPHTAAMLFWYLRNRLFFDLGLDTRDDVLLLSYEALLADPETQMRRLCDLLGFPFRPQLISHVEPRTPRRDPLRIDPTVRRLCENLREQLDMTAGVAPGQHLLARTNTKPTVGKGKEP